MHTPIFCVQLRQGVTTGLYSPTSNVRRCTRGGHVFGSTPVLDQAHQAVAISIEGITNDSTHGLGVEAAAPPQLGIVGDVLAPILKHLREASLAVDRRQIKD